MPTTQQLVERSLAAYRERIAIDDGGRLIRFGALADRSARLANALIALGAGRDRPAAIYLPNSFHFIETDLACMRAGITRVGISARLSADECQFIVSHSRAAVLITSAAMLAALDRGAMDGLSAIVLTDGDDAGAGYEALIARAGPQRDWTAVRADDPAYILYTSGTTGRPKGATHSQGGRVAALVNMMANELEVDGGSAMVHCAALTHGSGSKYLSFFARGARNIILPRFEPEEVAAALTVNGGTHSFMVPTMLQMLEEAGPAVRSAVARMRQLSFGGAPISNVAFGRALDAFGPVLVQVYGTSEAPHPLTVLRPDDYAQAADPSLFGETAGRAASGIELAIRDDDGRDLPAAGEGELVVRGPSVMTGYWHDVDATAEVIDEAGWYRTGDVAAVDDSGLVRFKDRKRELIISGGLNIYPSEVERVLAEHPQVREVAVVGCPDDRWGESVFAFVALRPGGTMTDADLIAWTEGRIAGYKKPRQVRFLDELPKGSTNKILKRTLRGMLQPQPHPID